MQNGTKNSQETTHHGATLCAQPTQPTMALAPAAQEPASGEVWVGLFHFCLVRHRNGDPASPGSLCCPSPGRGAPPAQKDSGHAHGDSSHTAALLGDKGALSSPRPHAYSESLSYMVVNQPKMDLFLIHSDRTVFLPVRSHTTGKTSQSAESGLATGHLHNDF